MICFCRTSALGICIKNPTFTHTASSIPTRTLWLTPRAQHGTSHAALTRYERFLQPQTFSRAFSSTVRSYRRKAPLESLESKARQEPKQAKKERWSEERKEQARIQREIRAERALVGEIENSPRLPREEGKKAGRQEEIRAGRGREGGRENSPRSPRGEGSKEEGTRARDRPASNKPFKNASTPEGEGEDEPSRPPKETWMTQKAALKKKFPEGWRPMKRLSPDALAGIRALHQQYPEDYTTEVLAEKFEVSPEAIRRILRSKWTPSSEEEIERQERWFERGKKVWSRYAELGLKPPKRWRKEGILNEKGRRHKEGIFSDSEKRRLVYGKYGRRLRQLRDAQFRASVEDAYA